MQLTQLARLADLPTRTVRYYADRGLIRPTRRSTGGYRLFDQNALRQLRFVRRMQGLGLTLRELHQLLRAAERQSCGQSSIAVEQRLRTQLDRVEERLRELEAVHHELASLLVPERAGCTDELCLCNTAAPVQAEPPRPRRAAQRA